jgi:hypothetical protein
VSAIACCTDTDSAPLTLQLASDEYVPARTPVRVLGKLREQLGHASPIELIIVDEIPEVLMDWNLLWHGLSNAVSNALKYGDKRRTSIKLCYFKGDERLVLEVANSVDQRAQARLIATYGEDGTCLLHCRLEGGEAMSTNVGSAALTASTHLLGGDVMLNFAPDETRVTLTVSAPRSPMMAAADAATKESLEVWFLDDDEVTRRVYQSSWVKPPIDARSRVLPEIGLTPQATDDVIRGFTHAVLMA